MFNYTEAAEITGVPRPTIGRWRAAGMFRGRHEGGETMLGTKSLEAVAMIETIRKDMWPVPPKKLLKRIGRAVETGDEDYLASSAFVSWRTPTGRRFAFFADLTPAEVQRFRDDPQLESAATLREIRDGVRAELRRHPVVQAMAGTMGAES